MELKAQGNRLYSQGKALEAIKAYGEGIDLVGEEDGEHCTQEDLGCLHMLYSNRSMAHLDLCLVDEALQDAECAIETKPDYGKAYLRRASVLLDLFDFKAALKDLDKAEELEPGLAPEGCESRLRATREKWVPNCYLRKQIELRKKHKCDYVVQVEYEGEELVEPFNAGSDFGVFKKNMNSLTRTGSCPGAGLLHFLSLRSSDIEKRILKTEEGQGGIEGGFKKSKEFKTLLRQQLAREFGTEVVDDMAMRDPSNVETFSDERARSHFLYSFLSKKNRQPIRTLVEAAQSFQQEEETPSYCLVFPGGPKLAGEKNTDPGILARDNFHAQIRAMVGLDLDCCRYCKEKLTDPDPPECICGEKYCSLACHTKDWSRHQPDCYDSYPALRPLMQITCGYWVTVLRGINPFKNQPHAVTLWKERGINSENCHDAFEQEEKFHWEFESKRWLQENQAVLSRMKAQASGGRVDPCLLIETYISWSVRMVDLDSIDDLISLPRLCAQMRMVAFISVGNKDPEIKKLIGGYTPDLKPIAVRFGDYVVRHWKDHPKAGSVMRFIKGCATGDATILGETLGQVVR